MSDRVPFALFAADEEAPLSQLLLVRHGQASLFSDDYDRLSALGKEQAACLARAWIQEGVVPDRVWCGSLQRQQASALAAAEVFAEAGIAWPGVEIDEGLNEYPAEELVPLLLEDLRDTHPELADMATAFDGAGNAEDRYRHFHRLLEALLGHWVRGTGKATLPIDWSTFADGARSTLRRIMRAAGRGATVAAFTSGGPIGISVQTVLEAPDLKALELNWRIHNASVTRYAFSGARVSLDRFNDTRHLPIALLTYR